MPFPSLAAPIPEGWTDNKPFSFDLTYGAFGVWMPVLKPGPAGTHRITGRTLAHRPQGLLPARLALQVPAARPR
ncbi:hypothetical protein, partial [Barnesiella intestinihominis]|uniref:hypothetical protein n=1 Tax=Barnesiella intestinihominis TaxID=487174 RepID=UPI003A8B3EFE